MGHLWWGKVGKTRSPTRQVWVISTPNLQQRGQVWVPMKGCAWRRKGIYYSTSGRLFILHTLWARALLLLSLFYGRGILRHREQEKIAENHNLNQDSPTLTAQPASIWSYSSHGRFAAVQVGTFLSLHTHHVTYISCYIHSCKMTNFMKNQ